MTHSSPKSSHQGLYSVAKTRREQMAPKTRSQALDTSTTTPNDHDQTPIKRPSSDEEVEREMQLQSLALKHRRQLLKLEAEHELEQRRKIHQMEINHRQSLNEIELRQCSAKYTMRLKAERMLIQFRSEAKGSSPTPEQGTAASSVAESAGLEANVVTQSGVDDEHQAENQKVGEDERMEL